MAKHKIAAALLTAAAGTAAVMAGKDKLKKYVSLPDSKRTLEIAGDKIVQKIFGKLSDSVPDKGIPFINRYDNSGFMEGSGYFLKEPRTDSKWLLGFAKSSIIPDKDVGDLYLGGYLAFPPNKVSGIINEQMIRAVAVDDNSGRGINVFAVIDCIGICGADIRKIRNSLKDLISEKNIVSINISATHCHSGVDTEGLWGDLVKAVKTNKKAVSKGRPDEAVSGKNPAFMEHLIKIAADTITAAVSSMKEGKLSYAQLPGEKFVHDKRPPYITDKNITVIEFISADNSEKLKAVFMAAHPTCYGEKQREIVCDFPRFMCDRLEEKGYNAMFVQGAQLAVATDRGPNIPEGLSKTEGIKAYGEAIAEYICSFDNSVYKEIEPMLNVTLTEVFLPCENKILEYAAKMKIVGNDITSLTFKDGPDIRAKDRELLLPTEVGFAEFGKNLRIALVPGELMPEIAYGGAFEGWQSFNGTEWEHRPVQDILGGDLAVAGLCNDFIGYIIPDNDFGSMFSPLHYEESVSAGSKTASNIVNAFERLKANADINRQ